MGLGIKTGFRRFKRKLYLARISLQTQADPEREALLLAHALEKGMGMPNPRKGFGQEKAMKLVKTLSELEKARKTEGYAFKESLAVLRAYCEFQKAEGVAIDDISGKTEELFHQYELSLKGGYAMVGADQLKAGTGIDFERFVQTRHSMRTYAGEPVTEEEIRKAVSLAKRAPSACNRQPWKFYYSFDGKKIQAIRDAIPPQAFLEGIPYYGVVTVEKLLFNEKEANQWFVNGGIFLGYLGLAFHHLGIGSCIFQYSLFSDTEASLRAALQIPDHEAIIAAVGFGKYPEEARCIMADRRPEEDIAIQR